MLRSKLFTLARKQEFNVFESIYIHKAFRGKVLMMTT